MTGMRKTPRDVPGFVLPAELRSDIQRAGYYPALVADVAARDAMQGALARWHAPKAAERIAALILRAVSRSADARNAASNAAADRLPPTTMAPVQNSTIA